MGVMPMGRQGCGVLGDEPVKGNDAEQGKVDAKQFLIGSDLLKGMKEELLLPVPVEADRGGIIFMKPLVAGRSGDMLEAVGGEAV